MSKGSNRPQDDCDEFAPFSDPDFELEAFIEFMAVGCADREGRTARQKVDDVSEVKRLRDQLYDRDYRHDMDDCDWDWDEDEDEEIEWH